MGIMTSSNTPSTTLSSSVVGAVAKVVKNPPDEDDGVVAAGVVPPGDVLLAKGDVPCCTVPEPGVGVFDTALLVKFNVLYELPAVGAACAAATKGVAAAARMKSAVINFNDRDLILWSDDERLGVRAYRRAGRVGDSDRVCVARAGYGI